MIIQMKKDDCFLCLGKGECWQQRGMTYQMAKCNHKYDKGTLLSFVEAEEKIITKASAKLKGFQRALETSREIL